MLAIFQQFGTGEIILILFLALLIFGAKRLPEIGKSFGKSLREFKDATKGLTDDVKSGLDDDKPAAQQPAANPAPERAKDE